MSKLAVDVYNTSLLTKVYGDATETDKRIHQILKVFPEAEINRIDKEILWDTPDGKMAPFAAVGNEIRVSINFAYPYFDTLKLANIAEAFERTKPTYLVTHTPNGMAVPAVIMSSAFEPCEESKNNCFPYMLTEKEGRHIYDTNDKLVYDKILSMSNDKYSSDKQLDEATKYKDNLGDHFGKDVSHDSVLARSARDVPQRIDKLLSIKTGNRALDVGCSCGLITAKFAEMGKKITGVEIVPELYEEAVKMRETLPQKVKASIDFINAPIEKSNFEMESFDVVYMTETFEHIPEYIHDDLFSKIISYLKANGSVVFSVPNRYPAKRYLDEERHRWDWFNHVTHFTQKSVEYFLSKYFRELEFYPVYDEPVNEGIFLVCKATGKK